jgi:PAS domain-containing protein
VLHAGWRIVTPISTQETNMAETLAALGGIIVDNARSHQEASKLAAWLQAIVDQMPSGVAVADAQGSTVLMNRAARKPCRRPAGLQCPRICRSEATRGRTLSAKQA